MLHKNTADADTEKDCVTLPASLLEQVDRLCRDQGVPRSAFFLAAFAALLYRYTEEDELLLSTPPPEPRSLRLATLPPQASFLTLLHQSSQLTTHPNVRTGWSSPDLELSLSPQSECGAVLARIQSTSPRLEHEVVLRAPRHYRRLLQAAVENPTSSIARLPLLSQQEREQLLVFGNHADSPLPQHRSAHAYIEAQAARSATAVALSFAGHQLSYQELNGRANQLARYLRSLGVGPEVLVGLHLERSLEMLIGLLAILKAGGAFLPLDPTYPQERLAFMVADARAPLLLTQERLLGSVPAGGARAVCLDRDAEQWAQLPADDLEPLTASHHLAYVIYTSGSTGTPKGALIEHAGLCVLIEDMVRRFQLGPMDRLLQLSRISFDMALLEIFNALCVGARLYLAPQEALLPGPDLLQLLREEQITALLLTPSSLAALPSPELPALRAIMVGGEACPAELVARWAPQRRFYNMYGPTEATICATIAECAVSPRRPPIGRPLTGVKIYVLDRLLQPVPVGVPGEIYIGGAGVGRGYLNRPELTAEKYLRDPLSPEPQARVYRTGDLGQWREDGSLEFLGRRDHQVKLRGFRIELGEIEDALSRHPAVREVVVVLREDLPGGKQLVAYAVPRPGTAVAAADLRAFLKERVPEYMIPSSFVWLDALPRTPSDKIDRKALPAPSAQRERRDDAKAAPRSPAQELLLGLCAEVLAVERVAPEENFFECGGDSLRAARLLARIAELFGVKVPLRALFTAATVAELASAIHALRRHGSEGDTPPILPVHRHQPIPATFSQQQIWLLAQQAPEIPYYNEPLTIRIPGPLDIPALQAAILEIARRHEALRTSFDTVDGQLVQVITDVAYLPLNFVDLSHQRREASALRMATYVARLPFDLSRAPLLRLTLIKLAPQEHWLFLTVHHTIGDGVSIYNVFLHELYALYQAFSQGKPSPLPPLSIQYADYALWQQQVLSEQTLAHHRAYWRKQLAGVKMIELPLDRPRPMLQSFRGAKHSHVLPSSLLGELRSLSRRHGVTLFMTLLSAFKVLVYRYSGQTDIAVGTVEAGRSREEVEPLFGLFVNTLVLRTDLSENPTFALLLSRVRETVLQAYDHQELPFISVVKELQPERLGTRQPIFNVAFTLEPALTVHAPGWEVSQRDIDTGTTKFDLTVDLDERPEGLLLLLEYDSDLFNESTIAGMATRFEVLLQSAIAAPDCPIADLELVSPAERRALMAGWSATQRDVPAAACIHDLITAQAARTPDAPALSFGWQTLSYAQLDEQTNQLARLLREHGVGPDVPVAICMERSCELVLALLAVLKAGGAYVPLDPSYAQARLAFMMEDSGAALLLTQQSLLATLPSHRARVLCLDSEWLAISDHSADALPALATADSLAYIIYTSGSTGVPKGVMLAHRGACNLAAAQRELFAVQPGDRVLQFASISFDASVWELLMCLTAGATLYLAPKEALLPGLPLLQTLRELEITIVTLVPSVLARLPLERLPALRTLIVAGEACPPELVRLWAAGRTFYNAYGPTEVTVCATIGECTPGDGLVTIGAPLCNTRCLVLDPRGRLAPIGVPGELHIGGCGLARGYLNRLELTRARFIPDPFVDRPGERLYKTGDRARLLPDGRFEFLGRLDRQVKLRGFRIELGEIEAALGQHALVASAAVMLREDTPGEPRLVAYVVPRTNEPDLVELLCSHLRTRMPEYMVPAAFVLLDALPLSASDKLDYKALPAPTQVTSAPGYLPPEGPAQEKLAALWSSALGGTRVGRSHRFFDLGGNSMLAVQLITRINQAFDLQLPVKSIFERPTIEEMAQLIDMLSHTGYTGPQTDLRAESELPQDIRPTPGAGFVQNPRKVLLTGATGFLGAFLLKELLDRTGAEVYCLVRAADTQEGVRRLRDALVHYRLWDPLYASRVIPVLGDLEKPLLGISLEQFEHLAIEIDAIYHSGATVNFIYPYSALKKTNVQGTQEVIRLACRRKVKPVHYISTGAVFGPIKLFTQREIIFEATNIHESLNYMHLDLGYTQSKWVAENMIWEASARGLPVAVFRIGFLLGDSQHGVANVKDLLCMTIKAALQVGSFPSLKHHNDGMVPVDYASRSIVHLSRLPAAKGKPFHIIPPVQTVKWNDFFNLVRENGYRLESISFPQWRDALIAAGQKNALFPLLPLITERVYRSLSVPELYEDSSDWDCSNVLSGLRGSGITCPELDAQLIGKYMAYLTETGFLDEAKPEVPDV